MQKKIETQLHQLDRLLGHKLSLIYDVASSSEACKKEIGKLLDKHIQLNQVSLLGYNQIMLPYLPAIDNMLIGLQKKDRELILSELPEMARFFRLSMSQLKKDASQLSVEETIIIQLARAIILQKSIIFFDDAKNHASEEFIDSILPVFKLIRENQNTAVVLVTARDDVPKEPAIYDQYLTLNDMMKLINA